MMTSHAWNQLTLNARRVLDRLLIEHMNHAGTCNGQLVVTYDDFEALGIRRNSIKPAINLAKKLGFLKIIRPGRGGKGPSRLPTIYALTWLPIGDSPPTNDWKRAGPEVSLPSQNIKSSNDSDTGKCGLKPAGRRRMGIDIDTEKAPESILENLVFEQTLNDSVGETTA